MLAPLIALSTPKDYHDNGPACQVRSGQGVGDGDWGVGAVLRKPFRRGAETPARLLPRHPKIPDGGNMRFMTSGCVPRLPIQLIVFERGCTRGCGGRCGAGTRAIGTSPSPSK